MKNKLSIIICIYNTNKEQFNNCLCSISNSILENFEVVIVDDGSTIDYSDIISSHSQTLNINYIKTKNHGTLNARLLGIEKAKGDYVCYVDSDDSISFCYHQASMLEIGNADIIINDWAFKINSTSYYCPDDSSISGSILSSCPLDTFFSKNGHEHSYYVLWNKIFKKSVLTQAKKDIEKLSIDKLVYAEDVLISYFAFSHAKLVKNTHLGFYFYHKHNSQEVAISSPEKIENQTMSAGLVFELISNDLKKEKLFAKYENNLKIWRQLICSTMFENAKQFSNKGPIDCIKKVFPECALINTKVSNSKYIKKTLLPNNIFEIDTELKNIYSRNSKQLIYCKHNSYAHKTLIEMKRIFNLNFEFAENKNSNCIIIKKDINTLKQKIVHNYLIAKTGLILFPPGSKIRKFLKNKLLK